MLVLCILCFHIIIVVFVHTILIASAVNWETEMPMLANTDEGSLAPPSNAKYGKYKILKCMSLY